MKNRIAMKMFAIDMTEHSLQFLYPVLITNTLFMTMKNVIRIRIFAMT